MLPFVLQSKLLSDSYSVANETDADEHSGQFRRASSGLSLDARMGDEGTGLGLGLGTLFCTIKYCFEKSALVVTVNRCHNLPAKDTAAKSR
jgi:hypothetical protein